ncbi:glycosyltransferase [Weissella cibaria]|uniref:glycosyltransferase n=1 Tax=Weissella cibaria TaxID=137591 RepID=UPI00223B6DEC|nr:glycosyltransferase [Weissella cibaria]MCT0020851.1 glycosyltransferase family 1 protein [Weissella cibaria]
MYPKIKVLHIGMTPNFGGVEAYVMNLYRNIDKRKVQFDFIDWYANKNIAYTEEIKRLGGKIYKIQSRRRSPISNFSQLNSIIRQGNYQYIYYNVNSLSDTTGMKSVLNLSNTKLIVHAHNDHIELNKPFTLIFHMLHKYFMKQNIIRLACSDNAGKWMFGNNQFTVIPNAIDVDKYKFNADVRLSYRKKMSVGSKTVYGCVARFSPQKNHDFLIKIFSEIYRKDNDSLLLLIGDGQLKKNLKQQVENLNLNSAVKFLGMRGDINNLLQTVDVMIAPSLFEGFGISVLEAQCAGVSCYVSDAFNDEVMQTPLIKKVPLSQSAEQWANQILLGQKNVKESKRKSYDVEIEKSGYSTNSMVVKMEQIFADNLKNKENNL